MINIGPMIAGSLLLFFVYLFDNLIDGTRLILKLRSDFLIKNAFQGCL